MTDRYARYTRLFFDRPHPRVLRVTMGDRPERLKAVDAVMHRELGDIWRDIDADPEVNSVIITGAGRAFSAGGDFSMIEEMMADFDTRARVWKEARDLVYNIINCGKPVVSAMRGPAVGAGLVCGLLADVSIEQGRADHRWAYAVGGRGRGSLGDRVASAVRTGEGEILPAAVRRSVRRRGGADRADLAGGGRCGAGREGTGGCDATGGRRTERDPLDEVCAEQLAEDG